jgi:hypothetical protein
MRHKRLSSIKVCRLEMFIDLQDFLPGHVSYP